METPVKSYEIENLEDGLDYHGIMPINPSMRHELKMVVFYGNKRTTMVQDIIRQCNFRVVIEPIDGFRNQFFKTYMCECRIPDFTHIIEKWVGKVICIDRADYGYAIVSYLSQ